MKNITIHRLSLQFKAGQVTHGNQDNQAHQAVELINRVLQKELSGLGADLIATSDEIEIESTDEELV